MVRRQAGKMVSTSSFFAARMNCSRSAAEISVVRSILPSNDFTRTF